MFSKENHGYFKYAGKVGIFLAVLFIICFFWYWFRPLERDLHLRLLRLSFFGFTGMNAISFIFGLVQSYIWGYIIVGILWLVGCCGVKSRNK